MENIVENNKFISDFLGIRWHKNRTIAFYPSILNCNMGIDTINELKFHKSWDWLMLVVEKIEEMDVVASFEISQPTIYIHASSVESTFKDIEIDIFKSSKIEAVYKAVVQFIEWYNQN